MDHSHSQREELRCEHCSCKFEADAWLVVDGRTRPELLERARSGLIHRVACPKGHPRKLLAPLLMFRAPGVPTVLFSPLSGATSEKNSEEGSILVDILRDSLGDEWDDSWIEGGLTAVTRNYLPIALREGLEAVRDAKAREIAAETEELEIPEPLLEIAEQAEDLEEAGKLHADTQSLASASDRWNDVLVHPLFATSSKRCQRHLLSHAAAFSHRRHQRTRARGDLERAVELWRRALALCPASARTKVVSSLARGLSDRFHLSGDPADLDDAIDYFREALNANPSDEERSRLSAAIAQALLERHKLRQQIVDLADSVRLGREALALSTADERTLAPALISLGNALLETYRQQSHHQALEEGTQYLRRAADLKILIPVERAGVLTNLGLALRTQNEIGGSTTALDDAIRAFREALPWMPTPSAGRSIVLNNLSVALLHRHEQVGNDGDLTEAHSLAKECVASAPPDSTDLAGYLSTLGNVLGKRYERDGGPNSLEECILCHKQAYETAPRTSADHAMFASNLANALAGRYEATGDIADLRRSIELHREAVARTPDVATDASRHKRNLATALNDLYERVKDAAVLEEAIQVHRDALRLVPPDAPEFPSGLTNLGSALMARHDAGVRTTDVPEIVDCFERAAAAAKPESPDYPGRLSNLAAALRLRHRQSGNPGDLERSIEVANCAVAASPPNSPHLPGVLANRAASRRRRFALLGDAGDRRAASSDYERACVLATTLRPDLALDTAKTWGRWALELGAWDEAKRAHDFALPMTQQLIRTQLLRADKETWLGEVQGLHARAAYARARCGDLDGAAVAMEDGNARLLSQALRIEGSELRLLRADHPEIVAHYRQLVNRTTLLHRRELEKGALSPSELAELRATLSEIDATVDEIRRLPGHADFLASPGLADIRRAAEVAPLVYICVTVVGGVGLVVRRDRPIAPVWLRDLTDDAVHAALFDNGDRAGYLRCYARWRAESGSADAREQWFSALDSAARWTWAVCVGPLLAELAGEPRAVLIPHGLLGMLPLHAACSPEDDRGRRVSALDCLAVSYAPNATALSAAARRVARRPKLRDALAVADPTGSLQFAREEVETVLSHFPNARPLNLGGDQPDRDVLLKRVATSDVLHFATHGEAGFDKPLDAGLRLWGGSKLTLRDLLGIRLDGVRLVVLSACETAVIGTKLPDELVFLPSGILQAGAAAVIGSSWAIDDVSTLLLMNRFYAHLCGEERHPVDALRLAQIELRALKNGDAAVWFQQLRDMPADQAPVPVAVASQCWRRFAARPPDAPAFDHVFYWAAFSFHGE